MSEPLSNLAGARFERVIQPWLRDLRRLAVRLTGNAPDADDLMQDTLMRLQSRPDQIADLDRPWPWLARVLYRRFVDDWRRARRQPEQDEDAEVDAQTDPGDRPDEAFERALTRERLQVALDGLPAAQREVVVLHDVEGYTLPEIATITETTEGTLKSRLHRARTALPARL